MEFSYILNALNHSSANKHIIIIITRYLMWIGYIPKIIVNSKSRVNVSMKQIDTNHNMQLHVPHIVFISKQTMVTQQSHTMHTAHFFLQDKAYFRLILLISLFQNPKGPKGTGRHSELRNSKHCYSEHIASFS